MRHVEPVRSEAAVSLSPPTATHEGYESSVSLATEEGLSRCYSAMDSLLQQTLSHHHEMQSLRAALQQRLRREAHAPTAATTSRGHHAPETCPPHPVQRTVEPTNLPPREAAPGRSPSQQHSERTVTLKALPSYVQEIVEDIVDGIANEYARTIERRIANKLTSRMRSVADRHITPMINHGLVKQPPHAVSMVSRRDTDVQGAACAGTPPAHSPNVSNITERGVWDESASSMGAMHHALRERSRMSSPCTLECPSQDGLLHRRCADAHRVSSTTHNAIPLSDRRSAQPAPLRSYAVDEDPVEYLLEVFSGYAKAGEEVSCDPSAGDPHGLSPTPTKRIRRAYDTAVFSSAGDEHHVASSWMEESVTTDRSESDLRTIIDSICKRGARRSVSFAV